MCKPFKVKFEKYKAYYTAMKFNVTGIQCINCSNGIKSHLKSKGINSINIDTSLGMVDVHSETYSSKEIIGFINELGYTARTFTSKGKKERLGFYLLVSTLLNIPLLGHMFVEHQHILNNPWVHISLSSPILLIGYLYFFKSALASIKNKKPNMNVLILIGSTAAFIYSLIGFLLHYNSAELIYEYMFFETTGTIITLVLLGNYIEKISIRKTTNSIEALEKLQPKKANKISGNEVVTCLVSELKINDLLLINQGDLIPTDGIIVSGNGYIDESMISGESMPALKTVNQNVIGGTLLIEGSLTLKVHTVAHDTVLSKIIDMVRSAQEDKPNIQQLGDKVSAVFIPLVLTISLTSFLINHFGFHINIQDSIMRAIAVLVISCPCAMGLATPTAVMVGVGRAAKNGVLIKGGSTIEQFAKTKTIVFDKTGTLTDGYFKIDQLKEFTKEYDVKSIIYELEKHASHPIAKSLVSALKNKAKPIKLKEIKETKGRGMYAQDSNHNNYYLGSAVHCSINDPSLKKEFQLFLVINEKLIAALSIEDKLKKGAKQTLDYFNSKHISSALLSGDKVHKCKQLSKALNINQFYAEQLPENKLSKIQEISQQTITCMIGDGINDGPALSSAQVGVSFSQATDVAIKSSSIVLLNDNVKLIKYAHQICTHTYLTIKQNLFWALAYNIIAIPLAALGFLSPMIAAFTMAFSDIIVIGNSIRLGYKNINS